jgi:hypothetical protein
MDKEKVSKNSVGIGLGTIFKLNLLRFINIIINIKKIRKFKQKYNKI